MRIRDAVLCLSVVAFTMCASACAQRRVVRSDGDAAVASDSGSSVPGDMSVALDAAGGEFDECFSFCTRNNACDVETAPQDCAADCTAIVAINEAGGCRASWDASYTCSAPLSPAAFCSLSTSECSAEFTSWIECVNTYCAAHASDPACATAGG
ncbi:MAG: hypothetical protein IPK60_07560 [Sandaracinaceae bacterium]|nr:hypothetical protein [Sandaracinaceae bacterium]